MIVDVDQQSQVIRQPAISTGKTCTTTGTGMVFPGYGNTQPIPIPEHTCDHIITVLPIPMSCLNSEAYTCSVQPQVDEAQCQSHMLAVVLWAMDSSMASVYSTSMVDCLFIFYDVFFAFLDFY